MEKSKVKKYYFIVFSFSIIVLLLLFFASLYAGRYKFKWLSFWNGLFQRENYENESKIILNLRLPRTIGAIIIGSSLSLAGYLFQEIFKNKLVSPNLLGVSNGAGVGAILAILIGLPILWISLMSFIFGIVTVICTIFLSKIFNKNTGNLTFVLAGIIIGSITSSIIGLIKYIANENTTLPTITFWLLGSLQNINLKMVLPVLFINSICILIVFFLIKPISLLSLGKNASETKGLNYFLIMSIVIIITTIFTATSVSISGTISWVGLIIPHIVRIFIQKINNGKNYLMAFSLCILWGAIFMLISDIISRTFTSSEIPISIITGIFGAIIFVITIIWERLKTNGTNIRNK